MDTFGRRITGGDPERLRDLRARGTVDELHREQAEPSRRFGRGHTRARGRQLPREDIQLVPSASRKSKGLVHEIVVRSLLREEALVIRARPDRRHVGVDEQHERVERVTHVARSAGGCSECLSGRGTGTTTDELYGQQTKPTRRLGGGDAGAGRA